jgi:Arc/MetJ family transcription regulator
LAGTEKYWKGRTECHTGYGMKMTMHIDENLLKRVMDEYGYESKTEAVEMALRELDRKARFRHFGTEGLGLTSEEWKDAVFPGYDPKNLAAYDPLSSKVAEEPTKYGK